MKLICIITCLLTLGACGTQPYTQQHFDEDRANHNAYLEAEWLADQEYYNDPETCGAILENDPAGIRTLYSAGVI